ncbi:hypothetical protein M407DRAFT_31354 [Tulasnella calospora MUT 4182]|uniref:Phosphatidylserine decarboxylase n=1 Tax=Tulasnella calospora MUT 4182 TaxID=1051891 RepID=A0A0C3Q6M5_9AGAM|nr:hypothetical protein M407DRAFT_31354 [Tulasnella calospora MUT 4182]
MSQGLIVNLLGLPTTGTSSPPPCSRYLDNKKESIWEMDASNACRGRRRPEHRGASSSLLAGSPYGTDSRGDDDASEAGGVGVTGSFLDDTVTPGREFRIEGLVRFDIVRHGLGGGSLDPAFVTPHVEAFIEAYDIKLDELLEPDVTKHKRSLKPGARTVHDANDLSVITSPADSRVTVLKSVGDAKKIKGQEFTLPTLLDDPHLAETFGKNPSIAIFRLVPQDYHRYHAPFKAKLGKMFHVLGTYFTMGYLHNVRTPQAINHDPDVFSANRRDVQLLHADVRNPTSTTTSPRQTSEPVTLALVSVGALLVGLIGWIKNPGDSVMKGEDLGIFQYGGSTVILVAPEGTIKWDKELLANLSGLSGVKGLEAFGDG